MAERIDKLHIAPFQIIQNKEKFCFGIDAVLLEWWAENQFKAAACSGTETGGLVADLGTGNGIIPILFKARELSSGAVTGGSGLFVTGFEIQKDVADMARRSVALNGFDSSIKIIEADIKNAGRSSAAGPFDLVVSNPPYMIPSQGRQSSNKAKMIARQELCCTLKDVVDCAGRLLKSDGLFCMIHRWVRVEEILKTLAAAGFGKIVYRPVVPFEGEKPTMVLTAARLEKTAARLEKTMRLEETAARLEKTAARLEKTMRLEETAARLEKLPDLVVYSAPGVYTEEVKKIYGRDLP